MEKGSYKYKNCHPKPVGVTELELSYDNMGLGVRGVGHIVDNRDVLL